MLKHALTFVEIRFKELRSAPYALHYTTPKVKKINKKMLLFEEVVTVTM